jgi:hypothetical protein
MAATDAKQLRAKVNPKKKMELVAGVAITRRTIIPQVVNGRIELEFQGLPEGTEILHSDQGVTEAVTLEEAKRFSEMAGDL